MAEKKETEEIGKKSPSNQSWLSIWWDVLTPPYSKKREAFAEQQSQTGRSCCADEAVSIDYTLSNPDTLTKYKSAAAISQKVLEAVSSWCVAGEKIVTICEKGDKLLDEEIAKVYRGKKIPKGKHIILHHVSSDTDNLRRYCPSDHSLAILFCHSIYSTHI